MSGEYNQLGTKRQTAQLSSIVEAEENDILEGE